jgi:hypothetical protein
MIVRGLIFLRSPILDQFSDADIRMVYPHRTMDLDGPLRNKIASYLATNYELSRLKAHNYLPAQLSLWGKLKRLGGSDVIHAWDMVSTYHNSPDSVRDATFIKVRTTPIMRPNPVTDHNLVYSRG